MMDTDCDILIIGSGNAGFSAAISAAQSSKSLSILLIDACPQDWAGGNTYFTAGAFRTTHAGLSDLLPLVNNVSSSSAQIDLDPYTAQHFSDDLKRVTDGRSDPDLGSVLVNDSRETVQWLKEDVGVRFQLSFNRQAYRDESGRWKFWGGLCLKTENGGKGLVEDHMAAADKYGISVQFDTKAKEVVWNASTGVVTGVLVERGGKEETINCRAVILAAGGFEANPELRKEWLGPGWQNAHVRGTPFNTGTLFTNTLTSLKAKATGDFSPTGCHSVAWDANSPPDSGNRTVSNEYTKSGYPLGIMLNKNGNRFVDEGVDFRNYTYAKFGRAILQQPDGVAFQIFDGKGAGLLREEEYREEVVERITASSIVELAHRCTEKGLADDEQFVKTVEEYNTAVSHHRRQNRDLHFDPAVRDGLSTQSPTHSLDLPKSNWALSIDEPPFLALKVTCGITFTFGGLAVHPETAGVISKESDKEIEGLYCVGEMMGGLFWGNYPGGSGLTSGAVFGRRAGKAAASLVLSRR
ncbi:flavo protein subunit of succinate dehydrogenase/fumarate reductase [Massarina eburnea CBS 473.64]|uniref:Flavo protein subunit of succinate dehydrogenase/fumarate reductase n=1 Tax=Massarina eburnea CBS 473.64 TaxID=1395130 RepID=A0A6A6RYW9_9PLEO|nr:flavo protein subunit of succinate dehydrogenase/fumarate reductase [Massarina eburnea CBS 473.64]